MRPDVIFEYPTPGNHRKHGPGGYTKHRLYRPWLRDEFTFRCVYCLKRETWGQATAEFDVEHFKPQSVRADLRLEYTNLVYSCGRCNGVKGDQDVDDPFTVMRGAQIRLMADGVLEGTSDAAIRMIRVCDLNSQHMVRWRMMCVRVVALAAEHDSALLDKLLGFPDELPKLKRLRPPTNVRAEGIAKSWAEQKDRGELPRHY